MTSVTLKRGSLLWRLASVYGTLDEWQEETDLCSVMGHVLYGFLLAFAIVALFSMLLSPLVVATTFAVVMFNTGVYLETTFIVCVFLTYPFFAGVFWYLIYGVPKSKVITKEPTILGVAWKSFKEKTCVRVRVE